LKSFETPIFYISKNELCQQPSYTTPATIVVTATYPAMPHITESGDIVLFQLGLAKKVCHYTFIVLTRIPSGESIWGSRSKKDRLLNNQ
jgi:hypothetical protein